MKQLLCCLNKKKEYNYTDTIQTSHDVIAYLMIWMNYTSAKELVKNKCGLFRSSKMNDTFQPPLNIDPNIHDLERSLSDKIGISVIIKNTKRNKGTITFSYKEIDQLNKIIEIIKSHY